jgi:DNA-directed RNA polymerase subunit RPC12/RpoP
VQEGTEVQVRLPKAQVISGACPRCKAKLTIPVDKLPKQEHVDITCPQCKDKFSLNLVKILGIPGAQAAPPKPGSASKESGSAQAVTEQRRPPPTQKEPIEKGPTTVKMVNGVCPKCAAKFALPLEKLPNKPYVELQCNGCKQKFTLVLSNIRNQANKSPAKGKT